MIRSSVNIAAILAVAASSAQCRAAEAPAPPLCPPPTHLSLEPQGVISRDRVGFTQGLLFHEGHLYESSGRYRQVSRISRIDIETGKVRTLAVTPGDVFGEGLAFDGRRLFQLTWRQGLVFAYDLAFKKPPERFRIAGEGWGLSYLRPFLVLSDGTSQLRFLDPKDFSVKRSVIVRDRSGQGFKGINELEAVDGQIFANVFETDRIIRIQPDSGCVTGLISMSEFIKARVEKYRDLPRKVRADVNNVLNGIAYDPGSKTFFVTGKNWPKIYRMKLAPSP